MLNKDYRINIKTILVIFIIIASIFGFFYYIENLKNKKIIIKLEETTEQLDSFKIDKKVKTSLNKIKHRNIKKNTEILNEKITKTNDASDSIKLGNFSKRYNK